MSQSANLQIASMHDWHWCGYAVSCRLNTRLSEMQRLRLPLRLPAMAQRLPRLWRRSPLSVNVCTPLPQHPLTLRPPLMAAPLWPMPTHRLSQVTTHCKCIKKYLQTGTGTGPYPTMRAEYLSVAHGPVCIARQGRMLHSMTDRDLLSSCLCIAIHLLGLGCGSL